MSRSHWVKEPQCRRLPFTVADRHVQRGETPLCFPVIDARNICASRSGLPADRRAVQVLISQRGLRPREAEPPFAWQPDERLNWRQWRLKKLEDMLSANCLNFLHVAAAAVTEVTNEHHARAFYGRSVRDDDNNNQRWRQQQQPGR